MHPLIRRRWWSFNSSLGFLMACVLSAGALAQPEQTAYTGPKKTVFIATFESASSLEGQATGPGLSQMLVDAMMKDGRFLVIERRGIGEVLDEIELGKDGSSTAATAPKKGQLLGASVIIRGTVTKFNPRAKGGGLSVGGGLMGSGGQSVGMNKVKAKVEIALRLIDAATGQIISTAKAEGTASAREFSADLYTKGNFQVGGSQFSETPLGQAADEAIKSALAQIATGMEKMPWTALVIENSDGVVYVNAGSNANLQPGTTLHIYRKVKELTDPATGALIHTITAKAGSVQVQTVEETIAIAKIISGSPVRGDMLRLN